MFMTTVMAQDVVLEKKVTIQYFDIKLEAVSYTHLRAHETLRSRMPSSA